MAILVKTELGLSVWEVSFGFQSIPGHWALALSEVYNAKRLSDYF